MSHLYDLIIIGGGPGGIGAAIESVSLGLKNILIIEKGDNHSQTIRKFYKDHKRVDKDYKGQVVEKNYKIPPSLSQRVNFNLDKCILGEKILVVGGGNSAAEYAIDLAEKHNVTLNYRRTEFSRLNVFGK